MMQLKANQKKILFILMIFATLFLVFIIQSSGAIQTNDPFADLPKNHASWRDVAETSQELVEKSDIIAEGTVIDSYTKPVHDMVFTYNIVKLNNITMLSSDYVNSSLALNSDFAKKNDLNIEILQTGGVYNDMRTRPFEEAPLYEIGKDYLFFLPSSPQGHYLPVGGYQGYANINDGVVEFPENLNMFPELNIELDNLATELSQFNLSSEEYFINTYESTPESFLDSQLN